MDILRVIVHCDNFINQFRSTLAELKSYRWILFNGCQLREKNGDLVSMEMNENDIKNFENLLKLFKVEKLIYETLRKGSNGIIFQLLFKKYSDLLAETYDLMENMVRLQSIKEGTYLLMCDKTLKNRKHIQDICLYGENRK